MYHQAEQLNVKWNMQNFDQTSQFFANLKDRLQFEISRRGRQVYLVSSGGQCKGR